jgi:hypothetical protein
MDSQNKKKLKKQLIQCEKGYFKTYLQKWKKVILWGENDFLPHLCFTLW